MGLDLGALFSGVSRGLGSVTDIRLAEHLRQIASQEQFGQRQQLADEAFGRQKELLSLRSVLDQQGERSGIEGELLRALGGAQAYDVPGLGAIPEDVSGLPTGDLQELIGQIQAAVAMVGGARQEREDAPKTAADLARTQALTEASRASAEANRALAAERSTGGGPSGQDGTLSDSQLFQIAKDKEKLRSELVDRRRGLQEELAKPQPTYLKTIIQDEIDKLSDEEIERQVSELDVRLRSSLGGSAAPGGLDLKSIIAEEVAKGQ